MIENYVFSNNTLGEEHLIRIERPINIRRIVYLFIAVRMNETHWCTIYNSDYIEFLSRLCFLFK